MTAVLAMEKGGMRPEELQRVALGSLSGALTALENGVVDATSIPGILHMIAAAIRNIASSWDRRNCRCCRPAIGVATRKPDKKNPDKLRAILAARREGVKYIYANNQDSIRI